MARKKAVRQGSQAPPDRHIAFLAYQLGFAGRWFPPFAAYFWESADLFNKCEGPDPVPDPVQKALRELTSATESLAGLVPSSQAALAAAILEQANRAWASFEGAWGGDCHQKTVRRRDESDPVYAFGWPELEGSPLLGGVWAELQRAIDAYRDSLPAALGDWVCLGGLVAAVFDLDSGGTHSLNRLPELQNQLSKMAPQPLLEGLPINLLHASVEQVSELHERLWRRFTSEARGAGQEEQPPAEPQEASPGGDQLPSDASPRPKPKSLALALKVEHPDWSVTRIAKESGCSRTGLYRHETFKKMNEVLKLGKQERPRGIQSRDSERRTSVDGVVYTDPAEEIED
jgi:hypothetical protein